MEPIGHKVKKGEKGIRIPAPIIGVKRKPQEEAEKDLTRQNVPVLVSFRAADVFDASQTEGAELPEHARVTGDAGTNRDRLIEFVNAQGIELEFNERIAPAMGMSYGGKIILLSGQSKTEEFSTLVHELAHEMLHKADRRTTIASRPRDRSRGHRVCGDQGWRQELRPLITSSFITAMHHCWQRVLKSSRKPLPSFWQHCSQGRSSSRKKRNMKWQSPASSAEPDGRTASDCPLSPIHTGLQKEKRIMFTRAADFRIGGESYRTKSGVGVACSS